MTDRLVPYRILVQGQLAGGLPVGTDWRVAEIEEHREPSGIVGEPDHVSTVITLTPAAGVTVGIDPERLRKALGMPCSAFMRHDPAAIARAYEEASDGTD